MARVAAGRIKEQALAACRKARIEQKFGQVVDKISTAQGRNSGVLVGFAELEMHMLRRQQRLGRVDKGLVPQPVESRLMQVVLRAAKRMAGFVADDVERVALSAAADEKVFDAREHIGFENAAAVNFTLHGNPGFFAPLRPQGVADGALADRQPGIDQPLFAGQGMKQSIVADDRVVKVDSDNGPICSHEIPFARGGA